MFWFYPEGGFDAEKDTLSWISEKKRTPIPAAHPYTDTYRKLSPRPPRFYQELVSFACTRYATSYA